MLTSQCFIALAACVLTFVGQSHAYCGQTPPVWRNNNITCPERAICADVFQTTRNWYNGTQCEERRILHNCMCPGGTVCPYNNPAHRLYASAQHEQYICHETCTLPFCSNIMQRPGTGRPTPVVSQTSEQNAQEFGDRTYYRMECRCPRHHTPYTRTPGVHRAAKAYSHRYNYQTHQFSTLFVCNNRGNENRMSDPCAN